MMCQSDGVEDFLLDDLRVKIYVTKMIEGSGGRNKSHRPPEDLKERSKRKLSVITIQNRDPKFENGIYIYIM